MQVHFGDCDYEFPSAELRELRDSNDIRHNPDAMRARLDQDGYLFFRGLIDRDKVMRGRQRILEIMDREGTLTPGVPVLEGAMPKGGKHTRVMGRREITHHPDVRCVLEGEELFDLFRNLNGEPVRTFDYKWLRAVAHTQFTGCHYDVVYMGRGSSRLMTAWVPFGDIPIELGTLCILCGSHKLPSFEKVRQTYGRMDVDRDLVGGWFSSYPRELTEKYGGYWATTNFRAGDVLTFGMYTMHASTRNELNKWRLSADVRFQPAADPVDERWVGENPIAHYAWNSGVELVPMEKARAAWGV